MVVGILIGMGIGGLVGCLLLLLPISYYMLSVIGIGAGHVVVTGLLGATVGAFLGGLAGYAICRE
jgi:hypothetical protein